ncbi:MAG: ParB/RepB/Spo0J family partition protein [bacterium]|nr:ParB/RepB/Spo0J family partition protein [bacterium]
MPKSGLPTGVKMRHDSHYVDQIAVRSRSIGRTISIESIYPNPEQPRTEFGDLTELTESIREKGVLEPLLVKPTEDGLFMIIAGERRWRSSKLAGLTEVPCIEMDLDEQGVAEIALIENLQRKDLNIWEEADGLAALASKFGYTQEEIAKKISKSRSTVTELMTVAGLPDDIRTRCRESNINSKSTLLEIARQFDDAAMHEFLDGLQSGKVLPKTKQRAENGQTAKSAATQASNTDGYSFRYSGKNPSFDLTLSFKEGESRSRAEILRALKSAFDAVKNETASL